MKKAAAFGLLSAFCLFFSSSLLALAGGLTVHGGKIDATVKRAGSYSYTMKVENTSDTAMDVEAELKGYGTSTNSDFIGLEPEEDNATLSARSMLVVNPRAFRLGPGDSQTITVNVRVPPEAPDGGRYAIVFVHTAPQGGSVATISGVAARVLLTIEGSRLVHDSEITAIVSPSSKASLDTYVTVNHIGNHHYKPTLRADLVSGGRVVGVATLKADWPLIPGYDRQFKLTFPVSETLQPGTYETRVEVVDDSGVVVARSSSDFVLETIIVRPSTSKAPPEPAAKTTASALPVSATTGDQRGGTNWMAIGGGAAGAVVLALGMYLFGVRRGRGR